MKNEKLIREIESIFKDNKSRYGVRRVWAELAMRGQKINHKKIQRLMNKLGLKGLRPKVKYHSYNGVVGLIANNHVNRDFKATKPDKKWATDVSQFKLLWGKCYLSPILDMFTGEIISYDLSLHPDFSQTTRMLDAAFKTHPNIEGLIFHSDQGWQYQMKKYGSMLANHGIIQSMSRKGNCFDNSIMESFFGTMKNEMFYGHEPEFKTFDQFKQAVDDYIYYFNNKRIKAKTKWMPPLLFREASMSVL
jgi:putative transposase